jgi:hypothetical protein
MLVFVTRDREFSHESKIIPYLMREFPQLIGIHQNVNPGRTNVILGREWRRIYGQDYLEERLGRIERDMRMFRPIGAKREEPWTPTPEKEARNWLQIRCAGRSRDPGHTFCNEELEALPNVKVGDPLWCGVCGNYTKIIDVKQGQYLRGVLA